MLLPERKRPMGDKWAVLMVGILTLAFLLLVANRAGYQAGYNQGAHDEAIYYGGRVDATDPLAILAAPCNKQPNACGNGKR